MLFCCSCVRTLFTSMTQPSPRRTAVLYSRSWLCPIAPSMLAQNTACKASSGHATPGYQFLSAADTIPCTGTSQSHSQSQYRDPLTVRTDTGRCLHKGWVRRSQVLNLLCSPFHISPHDLTWSERVVCSLSGDQPTRPDGSRQGWEGWRTPRDGRK